jgi:hypothetical protein
MEQDNLFFGADLVEPRLLGEMAPSAVSIHEVSDADPTEWPKNRRRISAGRAVYS